MPSKYRKKAKRKAPGVRSQLHDGRVPDPFDRRGSGADGQRVINAVTHASNDAAEVAAESGEPLMPLADIRRIAAARILGCEGLLALFYEHVPEGAAFPMSEGPVLRKTLESIRASGEPAWAGGSYDDLHRQFRRLVAQCESIRKTQYRAARGQVAARIRTDAGASANEPL